MSTRERWIVYPLLFMALGIALRDKVIPPTHLGHLGMQIEAGTLTTQRLNCKELVVNGPDGRPVIVAGTDVNGRAGTIETFTVGGMPQIRLFSSEIGGVVTAIERAGQLALAMGDTGQTFGIFAEFPELGQLISLTTLKLAGKPTLPHSPKGSVIPEKAPGKQPIPKKRDSDKNERS